MNALTETQNELPMINRILNRTLPSVPDFQYLLRLSSRPDPAKVLVIVHGISRQAATMLRCLETRADELNYSLIAPMFNQRSYGDYQRLGRAGRGHRADLALNAMLEDVQLNTGLGAPVHLIGFSGGAQFAHRYAYSHSERIRSLTIAAAGWYTEPTDRFPFPAGTGSTNLLPDLEFSVDGLLSTPTLTLVGEIDNVRDPAMRRSKQLDREQGRHRLARAKWFHQRVSELAADRYGDITHDFQLLPGSGHDFAEATQQGGLPDILFNFCERSSC